MEKIKKIIAIYPGRFQPFGQHHFETFKWLQKQFGVSNTFIVTSDRVDGSKSPLNFKEKSAIMQQFGIDKQHIIQVKNPYEASELVDKFDKTTTGLIMIYGKKDADRIKYVKVDGTPGYFQPYTNKNNMLPADQHGYIIVAPNIQINLPGFGEMSGTNLRKFIKDSGPEDFKKVMGWYTDELYNMLKDKFQVESKKINIDDYIDLFNLHEIVDQSIKSAKGITEAEELISEGVDNSVQCAICGESMNQIQYRHLKYKHDGMTMLEYRTLYPKHPLIHENLKNTGDKNPSKRADVKLKISENNPMKNSINVQAQRSLWRTNGSDLILSERMKSDNPAKREIVRKLISEKMKELWNTGQKQFKPFHNAEKSRKTREESGQWTPLNQLSERELYYKEVLEITNKSFKTYFYNISDANMRSYDYHLDHKYSIHEGFKNDVLPEIIGHYCNLEILPAKINESKNSKSSVMLEDLITDIQNSYDPLSSQQLLMCGGAAGHMSHIIEDTEMTFGDLKQIIKRALSGKLDVEQEVSEKTDGMALSVTYKDGEVRAARNKATIINPMTMAEVSAKFEGRGVIHDAFVFAMKDLQAALHKISSDKLHQIFEGGTKFVTLEIIYPDNQMTISYGPGMYLQIHNMTKYDDKGNKLDTDPNGANILQKLIKQVNANIQDKFEIIPPQVLKMNKDLNYETKLNNYTKYINALQSDYGLYDTDTIAEYYLRYWRGYIKSNFGITEDKLIDGLAERFAGLNKNFKLNKQTIPTESILVSIVDFDKNKAAKLQKQQVDKFEDVILKVSVDVLENATNYLAASPNDEVKNIRKKLSDAIKHIRASGDLEDISKLKQYIKKLENLGGSQKILPAEGLVFMYNGKMYKMTGSFVPVHRILGLVKFKK